jgi:UDP-N-acetyl-D-mannosaminuronic acid transferase (WecB/TagA/CpsF family)
MFCAMRRRSMFARQVMRRVNQSHVSERLREVAELSFKARIVLLGEQPDIVAELEQTLENSARLGTLAGES